MYGVDTIEFFLPVEPVAVQSERVAFTPRGAIHYQPKKVVGYKKLVAQLTRAALLQFPEFRIFSEGDIFLLLEFRYAPTNDLPAKVRKLVDTGATFYRSRRPDVTDNLPKGTVDAMTGILWADDALIVSSRSRKVYAQTPGIFVRVWRREKWEAVE